MVDRVRDRTVFNRFRSEGIRSRSGGLTVVRVARPAAERPAVAYAISRRVGSAVRRNTLRRRLRALMTEADRHGRLGSDAWLVIPSPNAATASFTTLREWLDAALAHQREAS